MGFTIPEIDTVLAKYAELSYKKNYQFILDRFENVDDTSMGGDYYANLLKDTAYEMTMREIEQGLQGFETKLNTISNSLG